jgi:hypothetical protein
MYGAHNVQYQLHERRCQWELCSDVVESLTAIRALTQPFRSPPTSSLSTNHHVEIRLWLTLKVGWHHIDIGNEAKLRTPLFWAIGPLPDANASFKLWMDLALMFDIPCNAT